MAKILGGSEVFAGSRWKCPTCKTHFEIEAKDKPRLNWADGYHRNENYYTLECPNPDCYAVVILEEKNKI